MERITDGRRNIYIHGNAERSDVPVSEFPADARIGNTESFVPVNMDEPKLYPGDVLVGVKDGEIVFAELIYAKIDDGVMVDPLDSGVITLHEDARFSKRLFTADEIHVYDDVVREMPDRSALSFDESAIERPETSRAR